MHLIYVVKVAVKYSGKIWGEAFQCLDVVSVLFFHVGDNAIQHKLSILMDNETWILSYSGGWGRRITELGQSGQLK